MTDLVDEDNGSIWISGDIDHESGPEIVRALMSQATQGHEGLVLWINSGGGNLADALAIVDAMRAVAVPVATVAVGTCQSAALLVLAAGEPGHRAVAEHCQLMHHGTSLEVAGTVAECCAYIRSMENLSQRADTLLDECCGTAPGFWAALSDDGRDHHITAQRAVQLGLADKLLGDMP